MADVYEKDLAQKTSLTTSDYIRVVGSDNVSYKQSLTSVNNALPVKAEVDALNSKSLAYRRALSSSDDCNTLTQGVYTFNTSLPQNAPNGAQYGILIVIEGSYGASVFNFQLLSTSGRGLYYRRKQGQPADVFSAWTKVTGTQV